MVMGAPQAGSLGLNLDLDLNKGVHLVRREGEGLKRPVFPTTRKISRLIEAVAILAFRVIWHVHTRGEACHWILSRLRLLANPVPLPPLEMTAIV